MSLNSLTGRLAQSATQRKELLDARDKAMRAGMTTSYSFDNTLKTWNGVELV